MVLMYQLINYLQIGSRLLVLMELDEKALLSLVIKNQMDNMREVLEMKSEFKQLRSNLIQTEHKLNDLMDSIVKMSEGVQTMLDTLCKLTEENQQTHSLPYL
jgi:hypothetical protein